MVEVKDNSVLILIDVQKAWKDPRWGKRNNQDAERVISTVLRNFREKGRKVIHVRHESTNERSPFRTEKPTFEFMDEALPRGDEMVITKHVNSAFIGTNLEDVLRSMDSPDVYILGFVTDHCVSTTARMSGNLDFNTFVIEDACATYDRKDTDGSIVDAETVHRANLASIDGEFASVIRSHALEF